MLSAHLLAADAGRIAEIVSLRNDLFHEVLWDRTSPGTGSRAGFAHADNLWRINDRLLFAVAGYRGPYLSFPWWNIGRPLM